jgi:hypothetical protein
VVVAALKMADQEELVVVEMADIETAHSQLQVKQTLVVEEVGIGMLQLAVLVVLD